MELHQAAATSNEKKEKKEKEKKVYMLYFDDNVGKFRPRLIELTSFKPKLLIRFIMNRTY